MPSSVLVKVSPLLAELVGILVIVGTSVEEKRQVMRIGRRTRRKEEEGMGRTIIYTIPPASLIRWLA